MKNCPGSRQQPDPLVRIKVKGNSKGPSQLRGRLKRNNGEVETPPGNIECRQNQLVPRQLALAGQEFGSGLQSYLVFDKQ
jgi:hypothetical protein